MIAAAPRDGKNMVNVARFDLVEWRHRVPAELHRLVAFLAFALVAGVDALTLRDGQRFFPQGDDTLCGGEELRPKLWLSHDQSTFRKKLVSKASETTPERRHRNGPCHFLKMLCVDFSSFAGRL